MAIVAVNDEARASSREHGTQQAIILAGGLGTRLRSSVPDLPKCMAPVAGKPFLHYVIGYLQMQGIHRFIFSLGYLHEVIETYVKTNHPELEAIYSIETEPLGTGAAIRLACNYATEENVLVLNGDTMFKIDVQQMFHFHQSHQAACTLALKPMKNFDRYGVVEINQKNIVQSFKEKQFYHHGLINGGVYAINVTAFLEQEFPEKFSFEKDYLEKYYTSQKMMGLVQDTYFIDIGIPEDFIKAGREFSMIDSPL
ncbi:MAG: nucleotidyltransferase family protein [Ferruginibacter sp.]|nr:nucleotidyltransferase family protein [Ferruginibacter sp.]